MNGGIRSNFDINLPCCRAFIGWLADVIAPGVAFGLLGDLIVGVVGSFLGGLIFSALGIGGGLLTSFVASLLGSVILLLIVRLVKRGNGIK